MATLRCLALLYEEDQQTVCVCFNLKDESWIAIQANKQNRNDR